MLQGCIFIRAGTATICIDLREMIYAICFYSECVKARKLIIGRDRRSGNLHLITYLGLRSGDRSTRQLNHTLQLEADRSYSKWRQTAPKFDYFQITVETYNVDLEGHSKSMHAGGWFDPQPSSSVQTTSSEEAEHPLQRCVSQLDTISHSNTPGYIVYSEHNNQPARPVLS